jgi:uncharacterized coiled-coil protein SlyX
MRDHQPTRETAQPTDHTTADNTLREEEPMSNATPSADEPSLAAVATALESFVEATTAAMEAADAPASTFDQVADTGETLIDALTAHTDRVEELEGRIGDLEARVAEQADRIEQLESALSAERETRSKEAAEDRKRLHELETRIDQQRDTEHTPTDEPTAEHTQSSPTNPPETPLEDVIRIPEHLVEESLTANQRRARFVAKDAFEYTKQVPAGRAITSSELRRVLTASEDTTIYTETVSRVIRFLDELGDEAVRVRESKQSERVVVFTDAFVERVRVSQSRVGGDGNTVVTDKGA